MRALFVSMLVFTIVLPSISQEIKEITAKTNVVEATVFINGARVVRKKTIEVPAGKSIVRFNELSPYLDSKTVNVVAKGMITVLSVNHKLNYADSVISPEQISTLDSKIKQLNLQIQIEQTNLSVINDQISFLQDNRIITGKEEAISMQNYKDISQFYGEKLSTLKLSLLDISTKLNTLNTEIDKLNNQRNQLGAKTSEPQGEVAVKLDAKTATRCEFELSYFVSNAGWFPSYDLRAVSVNEPIELVYKANVHQSTKEEWKNVKLKFSSTDPQTGSIAPQLVPYLLDYNRVPPRYSSIVGNQLTGYVFNADDNSPMPGVAIQIVGTTIGTISDINGRYTISLPSPNAQISYSFIGCITEHITARCSSQNIYLKSDVTELNDVVVVGYGATREIESSYEPSQRPKKVEARKSKSYTIPIEQIQTTTAFEFEIKTPYTILADNQNLTIDMDSYSIDAAFEYYSVPKIDKDAFLIANITNWERLNLLDGEANLFYENSFVGKTVIDTRGLKDTLNISFGRDRAIAIKRDKSKDYTSKPFIGAKKEIMRDWLITIKNNKNVPISLTIFDQVPVSTSDDIEVNIDNLSSGQLNKDKGEIQWKLQLAPLDKKEINLKYRVKYPKERNLIVE